MVDDNEIAKWFKENLGFIPDRQEFPTLWESVKRELEFLKATENCEAFIIFPNGEYSVIY